jgi:hypothetical protein
MTPDECRAKADECDKLSTTALSPQTREAMRKAAAMWRRLAEGDDRLATELPANRSSLAQNESAPQNGSVTKAVKNEG